MPNQLVQFYRQQNPDKLSAEELGMLSDDDITMIYASQAEDYKARGVDLFTKYPDLKGDFDRIQQQERVDQASLGGELSGSFGRAMSGLKSMAVGTGALIAQKVGADETARSLAETAKGIEDEAADQFQPAVPSYKDVDGVKSAALYVAQQAGNVLPSIGESVVAAGVGAAVGAAAGSAAPGAGNLAGGAIGSIVGLLEKQAIKALLKAGVDKAIKEELQAVIAGRAKAALSDQAKAILASQTKLLAARVGGVIGGGAASGQMNTAETFLSLQDEVKEGTITMDAAANIALTVGTLKAIPDTVLPAYVSGKLAKRIFGSEVTEGAIESIKPGFYGYLTRVATELGKGMPWEGTTEGFQQFLDVSAERYARFRNDPAKLNAPLNPEEWEDVVNAAIGGAIGGSTAAVTELVPRSTKTTENQPTTEETSAAPVVTPPQPPTGEDIVKAVYEIDKEKLTQLAQRKLDDPSSVVAEEAKLRPDERVRFIEILTTLSEERRKAKEAEVTKETDAKGPEGDGNAAQATAPVVTAETPSPQVQSAQPAAPEPTSTPAEAATVKVKGTIIPEGVEIPTLSTAAVLKDGTTVDLGRRATHGMIVSELGINVADIEFLGYTDKDGNVIVDRTVDGNFLPQRRLFWKNPAATNPAGNLTPAPEPEPEKKPAKELSPVAKRSLGYMEADLAEVQRGRKEVEEEIIKLGGKLDEKQTSLAKAVSQAKSQKDPNKLKEIERRITRLQGEIADLENGAERQKRLLQQFATREAAYQEAVATFNPDAGDLSITAGAVQHEFGSLSIDADLFPTTAEVKPSDDEVSDAQLMAEEGAEKAAGPADKKVEPGDLGEGKPTRRRKSLPGYYELGEGHTASDVLEEAVKAFETGVTDADKDKAARIIGELLTDHAHAKTGGKATKDGVKGSANRARTRRITAWLSPQGQVLLTGSLKRTFGKIKTPGSFSFSNALKAPSRKADDFFRFSTDPNVQTKPGSTEGTRGIRDMLDAGFRPFASMLLRSPRYQAVRIIENRDLYDAEFGTPLKEARDSAYGGGQDLITTSTGEVVNTRQLVGSEVLEKDAVDYFLQLKEAHEDIFSDMGEMIVKSVKDTGNPPTAQAVIATFGERVWKAAAEVKDENGNTIDEGQQTEMVKLFQETLPKIISGVAERHRRAERKANKNAAKSSKVAPGATATGAGSNNGDNASGGQLNSQGTQSGQQTAQGQASQAGPGEGNTQPASPATGSNVVREFRRWDKIHQEIDDLLAEKEITPASAREYHEDLNGAENIELAWLILSRARAESRGDRMRRADPSEPDRADLATNRIIPSARLMGTVEDIFRNIRRLVTGNAPSTPHGLMGEEEVSRLQDRYPNLKEGLLRIAKDNAVQGATREQQMLASLAKSLSDTIDLSGAVLRLGTDPDSANLGRYSPATGELTVFVDNHGSEADLQRTIVHEALHVYTSRLKMRAKQDPGSLAEFEQDFLQKMDRLVEAARLNGLVWQNSTAAPEIAFDEFVAAAMTDPGFRKKLDGFPAQEATSIWAEFKKLVSKLIQSLLGGFDGLIGNAGVIKGGDAQVADELVLSLLDGYVKAGELAKSYLVTAKSRATQPIGVDAETRYRKAEGLFRKSKDLTIDTHARSAAITNEAKRMMAVVNGIDDAVVDMFNAYLRAGGGTTATGTTAISPDYFWSIINSIFKGVNLSPDEARASINDALTSQGGTAVSQVTRPRDLERLAEAPKANLEILNNLQRLAARIAWDRQIIEDAFGKKNITGQLATAATELSELLDRFDDMSILSQSFLRELRRSLNETEDVGAGSFAKALGVTAGRKAALQSASAYIQANQTAYADGLQGLADLGLDYSGLRNGTLTAVDVNNAVNASSDPALNFFRSEPARLAYALQFARKRPEVMDLMVARRGGSEMATIREIIAMATSNRDDAFQQAAQLLTRLGKLKATGQRLIDRIREKKAEHRELLDTVNQYATRLNIYHSSTPALERAISNLEQSLQLEGHIAEKQWQPVNGARYTVPASPNQRVEDFFLPTAQHEQLVLGERFDPAKVRDHAHKLQAWVDANASLAGTAHYNLVRRQAEQLLWVVADAADRQLKRGFGGVLVRLLGDAATKFEFTGLQSTRELARQVRQFTTFYETELRSVQVKEFYTFDRLYNEAMTAAGFVHEGMFDDSVYSAIFGFLENRQDLLDPSLSFDQQMNRSLAEARRFFGSNAWARNSVSWQAIEKLIKQSVTCSKLIQDLRQRLGLKVRDTAFGGEIIFREAIGHPLHTLSRTINDNIRLMARKMFDQDGSGWLTPWADALGAVKPELTKARVSGLYTANRATLQAVLATRFTPEVFSKFVRPLVSKVGKTNFMGPEVGGVRDSARHEHLLKALDAATTAGGDMLVFAEELHRLSGGTPATLADFVGETMATFQSYAAQLNAIAKVSTEQKVRPVDDTAEVSRAFLESRKGEDFPAEWLTYRKFGHRDYIRYTRIMAQNAALGESMDAFNSNFKRAVEELEKLEGQYKEAIEMRQRDPAAAERMLNDGGLREARKNATKNLQRLRETKASFDKLLLELNGAPQTDSTMKELLSLMAGWTVQGLGTAFTDTMTFAETPFRKFGLSREALSIFAGTWKHYFKHEALPSLAQAIGRTFQLSAHQQQITEILNRNGLADVDALNTSRGFRAFGERYREEVANLESFEAILGRSDTVLERVKGVAGGVGRRAIKAARIATDMGVGIARDPEQAAVSVRPLAPFTVNSLWMHRATARMWLDIGSEAVNRAIEYFRAHPADAANPAFQLNAKTLGYSTRSLAGFKLNDQAFQFLNETLQRNGISLEEAARNGLRTGTGGLDALSPIQVKALISMAQSEILLGSSITTRPTWTMNSAIGNMVAPLVGWSLYKTVDLVKTTRNPKLQAEAKAFGQAMTAFVLAVMPATVAYAWMRDEYEQEVLGKKANVLSIKLDENLPFALADNLSRLGALGVLGEIPNAFLNPDTTRELSIDSRVFVASSLRGVVNSITKIVHQDGTTTWDSVWRQFLSSIGGAGYLHNFDVINNLLGLDNSERRVVKRINVANHLRVAGRELGLDLRVFRGGMVTMPNPIKPWVSQMVLAAYANDAVGFQSAYKKALLAAQRAKSDDPQADPYAEVAEAYARMNPLKTVFNKSPSTTDYQRMLTTIGDNSYEVAQAISNFNAYGAQIPSKRGGKPLKPFYGIDRTESIGGGDYRSLTVNINRVAGVPDYRQFTVR
jgi:phage terminase small subunit